MPDLVHGKSTRQNTDHIGRGQQNDKKGRLVIFPKHNHMISSNTALHNKAHHSYIEIPKEDCV